MNRFNISVVVLALLTAFFSTQAHAQAPVACQETYTVQSGDWLIRIAERRFGDARIHELILQANNANDADAYTNFSNPNLIHEGDLICIPTDEEVGKFLGTGSEPEPAESITGSAVLPPRDSEEASSQLSEEEKNEPTLVGTVWLWQETLTNNGEQFAPADPGNYSVQFLPDSTISIQADCNQVGGSYTVTDSQLTIVLGPTTLVACPEGSMGDQFVANLGEASIHFIEEGDLLIDLKFDSGTMRLSAQSGELAGTSWVVTGYNNGSGGVVSILAGTEMTANFDDEGTVSGSAGCNSFSADYEAADGNIVIGPVLTTRMFCAEPESIMEQEQVFQAALQSVTTYQIGGNQLELRTADGSTAITFEPEQNGAVH